MEINSGVHLLKSSNRQVALFTSGGLGLGSKNLVLLIHHWSACNSIVYTYNSNLSIFAVPLLISATSAVQPVRCFSNAAEL